MDAAVGLPVPALCPRGAVPSLWLGAAERQTPVAARHSTGQLLFGPGAQTRQSGAFRRIDLPHSSVLQRIAIVYVAVAWLAEEPFARSHRRGAGWLLGSDGADPGTGVGPGVLTPDGAWRVRRRAVPAGTLRT
jgi:hypothetical protein